MTAPSKSEHRIEWRMRRGWGAVPAVICEADPLDGRCRNYCPLAECEEGCVAPDEHEQMNNPTCNVKDWLESSEVGDFYMGDETPVRDGDIKVWWDGSGIAWEYATIASTSPDHLPDNDESRGHGSVR